MCLIHEADLTSLNPLETGRGEPYAVFKPAISSTYPALLNKTWSDFPDRERPAAIANSFEPLNFFDDHSPLLQYKWGLYSYGHATGREKMFQTRDRVKTVLFGDSSGYQIATGATKTNWVSGDLKTLTNQRELILNWLQKNSDIALTLDVPTASIAELRSPIESFRQCLDISIENHRFFEAFLDPSIGTKFLNIVQGRTIKEQAVWLNEVRKFKYTSGWAFSYFSTKSFERLLLTICRLQHEGLLHEASNLHILGCTRLRLAMLLTTVMRGLREHVNPDLVLSYDASNPTLLGGKYKRAYLGWHLSPKTGDPTFTIVRAPQGRALIGSDQSFVSARSPIGRNATLGDFNVDRAGAEKTYDDVANSMLMNHNLYVHIQSIMELNRIMDAACMQGAASLGLREEYTLAAQAVEKILSKKSFSEAQCAIADNLKILRFVDSKLSHNTYTDEKINHINWASDELRLKNF